MVLWNGKIFRPASSVNFKQELLKEFHDSPLGDHAGIQRTYLRLIANFYWYGVKKDVQNYIDGCAICQQIKYVPRAPYGLLQPLDIPTGIWEDVSMDFITSLPNSDGFTVVLVVVDRLSKGVHFGALYSNFTAQKVAALFMDMVCKLHGFPKSIVCDRDAVFLGNFLQELFKL